MGCFSFRRGDIVWVRAIYPHSWCPALVLRTDLFGVLVSFFGSDPPPRYFLESQVCSFDHNNFTSMVNPLNSMVLSRALSLVGQRASLSLKCPCLLKPAQKGNEEKGLVGVGWDCKSRVLEAINGFFPLEALRFVLGVAVSPWIDDEGLVAAVTVSAQVDGFRRYSSLKQKLVYREGRKLEKESNTIAQKVGTLGDKCPISSERVDNNLTDSLTFEAHMKKPSESLHKNEANCVPLKRQLEQPGLVHPCSKLRKTKPFFSLSRACAYLQKYGDSVNIDVFDSLSSSSLIMFNVPLIEHTSLCSGSVETDDCQKHEDNADTINDGATCKSCVNMPEPPQDTTDSLKDNGTCKSFADVIADVKDDSVSCLPQPSPSKLFLNDAVGDQVSRDEVGSANVVTTKTLMSPHTIVQHNIQCKESDCVTSVRNYGKLNEVCFKENYKDSTENQAINSDHATSITSNGNVDKVCNKGKHTEKIEIQHKDSGCDDSVMDNGNVDKVCIEEKCKNTEVWLKDSDHATTVTNNGKVKKVCFKERCDENTVTQSKDNDCATSVTNNRKVNKVSEEKPRVNVDLPQPVTVNLLLNSQPKSLDYSHSTIVHMKFPKGIDPPSKEELIRKFRPYGPIDILNTKLYPDTGAARIVFLHHVDAVNAYEDAKKEKVFVGQLNIRFWLDPFDHKRGVKFLQPTLSRNHKPCLKIASSVLKDEKKSRRVRFFTSPSSLPPLPPSNLKSCLKTSSCLGKDEKKGRRVRFLMRS